MFLGGSDVHSYTVGCPPVSDGRIECQNEEGYFVQAKSAMIATLICVVILSIIGPVTAASPTDYSRYTPAVKAYFENLHPALAGTEYVLTFDAKDNAWLGDNVPGAVLVQVYARYKLPEDTGTFIIWNDRVYAMPDQFNEFIADSRPPLITTPGQAAGVAECYAQAWEPDGHAGSPVVLVLQSAEDIPHETNPLPPGDASSVTSPRVSRSDISFEVTFTTWSPVGGFLRKWQVIVSPNGEVTGENALLDKYVGDSENEGAVYERVNPAPDSGATLGDTLSDSTRTITIGGTDRFIIHWRPEDFIAGVSDDTEPTVVNWVDQAARDSWQRIVTDAGFDVPTDPTIDIYIWNDTAAGSYGIAAPAAGDGAFCNIYGGGSTIVIYVTEHQVRLWGSDPGYYNYHVFFPEFQDAYTATICHEFLHSVQWGYKVWNCDNWITEGQARFSPTYVITPGAGELWQNSNLAGLAGGPYNQDASHRSKYIYQMLFYLGAPWGTIETKSYDACIYWRYVFEHYGGISKIRQIDEQIKADDPGGSLCNQVTTINKQLPSGTTDIGFTNFAEANYLEFSPWAFARDNEYYQSSDRYYGNVDRTTQHWAPGATTYSGFGGVGACAYSAYYVDIIPDHNVNSMRISVNGPTGSCVAKVYTATGTMVTITPIPLDSNNDGSITLSAIGSCDVIGLMVARPDCGSGGYSTWQADLIQAPTTTTVSSSQNPSLFGQPVTFTATVTDGANGNVQFTIDGDPPITATLNGASPNQASLAPISNLAVGPHSIVAQYAGDTNYLGSTSDPLTQTVSKASTTTVVTSSNNPSVWGQPVTFTAAVSIVPPGAGTLTGNVEFFDGASSLGTAPVTAPHIDVDSLTVADHIITARYGGDGNFLESTSPPITQTVNKADTTTTLTGDTQRGEGADATFTATVAVEPPGAGIPTGSVQFLDNGVNLGAPVPLIGGTAALVTNTLPVGMHVITATYSGDMHFNPSTSPPHNLLITPRPVVTSFGPHRRDEAGKVKLAILGNNFQNGATASLVKGTATLPVITTGVTTPSRITATATIPRHHRKLTGRWDLVVTNLDGGIGVRTNTFRLI